MDVEKSLPYLSKQELNDEIKRQEYRVEALRKLCIHKDKCHSEHAEGVRLLQKMVARRETLLL